MATQTKVNGLGQVVQEHIIRPRVIWLVVAITAIILALVISSAFMANLSTVGNEFGNQRALDAATARYTALAEFHLAEEANRQRAIEADAACYTGLAEFYHTENMSGNRRAFEADAARYTALAEYYATAAK